MSSVSTVCHSSPLHLGMSRHSYSHLPLLLATTPGIVIGRARTSPLHLGMLTHSSSSTDLPLLLATALGIAIGRAGSGGGSSGVRARR
ncbi:hypothetical protein IMZ48_16520 [Candidatus Bathyarchaeota archaeon]|nr:hypothetical protein [Candidatus Bathyarchaeota archaeon]